MNKLFVTIFAMMAFCFSSCSGDNDEMSDRMCWSVDNQSPDNIKYDCVLDAVCKLHVEVNYKGGDITLICNNYDNLHPIGINGSNTYDCGWGVFTVEGRMVKCHFPEDASGREPAWDQITISAMHGKEVVNTILHVERSFGELVPEPGAEELADNYKFKLVQGSLMPFMNDDFGAPAPFDNITYRITDFYGRHQVFGFPEFTQPYDSIVWCADGFPNTVRIYERRNTATSAEEHFSSQWSTHFFKSGEVKHQLKGYRHGEVIYSTSLTTYLYERDFLCYDWNEGSVVLQNPGNTGIYCQLDSRYEYQAGHTQEKNGTRYAHINVWNKNAVPEKEFLLAKQDALIKLMADIIGAGVSALGRVESFKCLPTEGVEAVKFWENKTTRILLLHELPDEDYGLEDYYLHFEAK
ncbi:MAG: hypothetical protein NC338_07600 [Firmicutes bacterium]|nr:hypothetical protein [Bacillota bacterium]MCM1401866.1 hypothetical protein [Bacteroides sp.]MCM1476721.1 hypothetical protein [Bacteroides sp.]